MEHKKITYSMFEAIAEACGELKSEADRIAAGKKLAKTITCGHLQKILDYARKATKELKEITFVNR